MSGELVYTYDVKKELYIILPIDIQLIEWLGESFCVYCGANMQGNVDRCPSCGSSQNAQDVTDIANVTVLGRLKDARKLLGLSANDTLYVCDDGNYWHEVVPVLPDVIMELKVLRTLSKKLDDISSMNKRPALDSYFFSPSHNVWNGHERPEPDDADGYALISAVMQCKVQIY